MIEAYSENITVASNSSIPLNTTAFESGCTVVRDGASSFKFKCPGIYELECNATATASAGGLIAIQLVKDQIPQPQSVAGTTAGDTTSSHSMSFSTLINVESNCCSASPVNVHVQNIGVDVVFDTIDVVVKRVGQRF